MAPVNVKDEAVKAAAEDIAKRLEAAGFDVILDDRNERPGVKFKDADLVGIPFRITVGKQGYRRHRGSRFTFDSRSARCYDFRSSGTFSGIAPPGGMKFLSRVPGRAGIAGHGNN